MGNNMKKKAAPAAGNGDLNLDTSPLISDDKKVNTGKVEKEKPTTTVKTKKADAEEGKQNTDGDSKKLAAQGVLIFLMQAQAKSANNSKSTGETGIQKPTQEKTDTTPLSNKTCDSTASPSSTKPLHKIPSPSNQESPRNTVSTSSMKSSSQTVVSANTDDQQTTLLMKAANEGDEESVELLVNRGAAVNMQVDQGYTPLMLSAQYGHTKAMRVLIESGAFVDTQNNQGTTALMTCSANGHKNSVRLLLDKNADMNIQNSEGQTALIVSSNNGYVDIVEMLLTHTSVIDGKEVKANTELKDYNNHDTALTRAAVLGKDDVVEVLLDKGSAFPDAQNKKDSTALNIAAGLGHLNLVNILLTRGANTDILDDDWDSPLLSCCQNPDNLFVVQALLRAGANVDLINKMGVNALVRSAYSGSVRIVSELLQYKKYGKEELEDAIKATENRGHKEVMEVLKTEMTSGKGKIFGSTPQKVDGPSRTDSEEKSVTDDSLLAAKGLLAMFQNNTKNKGNDADENIDSQIKEQISSNSNRNTVKDPHSADTLNTNIKDNHGKTTLHISAEAGFGAMSAMKRKHSDISQTPSDA